MHGRRRTGAAMKILLIEDDPKLSAALRRGLEADGLRVDVAHDGDDGLWMASEGSYAAIVLDILLPGRNGFRVCADLRARGDWTPILMLTAKDGDLDEAEALDTGADDYVTKPFSYPVLLARLRALLRRAGERSPAELTVADLQLDPRRRRVERAGKEIELTAREFDVLELLMRRTGEVLSKQDVLAAVWDFTFDGDPNIVEVYVARLRRKVDDPFDPRLITTVRGAGYRLEAPGA
jgi:two-component system OmpR family response regulator